MNDLHASFDRGTLNGTKTGIDGTPSRSQDWSLDPLGNWSTLTSDGSDQDRSHNAQNQITSIQGLTSPTYDGNGNMTRDQQGHTLVYDAATTGKGWHNPGRRPPCTAQPLADGCSKTRRGMWMG